MYNAIALANWLQTNSATPLDHLRLQKLLFYAFGAAAAHDLEHELGDIRFVAWKHGPVNVDVYTAYRGGGREPLPLPSACSVPQYSAALEQVLRDVLGVYGRLSPWQLREESHLERPWLDTEQSAEIAPDLIKAHFAQKFAAGDVELPRHLLRAWSFDVDGIPTQRWQSLRELAHSLSA